MTHAMISTGVDDVLPVVTRRWRGREKKLGAATAARTASHDERFRVRQYVSEIAARKEARFPPTCRAPGLPSLSRPAGRDPMAPGRGSGRAQCEAPRGCPQSTGLGYHVGLPGSSSNARSVLQGRTWGDLCEFEGAGVGGEGASVSMPAPKPGVSTGFPREPNRRQGVVADPLQEGVG